MVKKKTSVTDVDLQDTQSFGNPDLQFRTELRKKLRDMNETLGAINEAYDLTPLHQLGYCVSTSSKADDKDWILGGPAEKIYRINLEREAHDYPPQIPKDVIDAADINHNTLHVAQSFALGCKLYLDNPRSIAENLPRIIISAEKMLEDVQRIERRTGHDLSGYTEYFVDIIDMCHKFIESQQGQASGVFH
ncbi:MAG: hypothetical protein J0M34_03795 [Alphaproteobacteria bacterium]|nr:hypothetical protein [Alphaproteobacteria bacterium]